MLTSKESDVENLWQSRFHRKMRSTYFLYSHEVASLQFSCHNSQYEKSQFRSNFFMTVVILTTVHFHDSRLWISRIWSKMKNKLYFFTFSDVTLRVFGVGSPDSRWSKPRACAPWKTQNFLEKYFFRNRKILFRPKNSSEPGFPIIN